MTMPRHFEILQFWHILGTRARPYMDMGTILHAQQFRLHLGKFELCEHLSSLQTAKGNDYEN